MRILPGTIVVPEAAGTQGVAIAMGAISYMHWVCLEEGLVRVELQAAARILTYTIDKETFMRLLQQVFGSDHRGQAVDKRA